MRQALRAEKETALRLRERAITELHSSVGADSATLLAKVAAIAEADRAEAVARARAAAAAETRRAVEALRATFSARLAAAVAAARVEAHTQAAAAVASTQQQRESLRAQVRAPALVRVCAPTHPRPTARSWSNQCPTWRPCCGCPTTRARAPTSCPTRTPPRPPRSRPCCTPRWLLGVSAAPTRRGGVGNARST